MLARTRRRSRELGALAVPVALALWTAAALGRSLWEDEFHALHHVRAPGLAGTLEAARRDNHPPLVFLLQDASVSLLGESELALRLPSLLAGLLLLLLALRASRDLAGPRARAVAPWVVALSSFALTIASEGRMYAWLALAALGLVVGVHAALSGRRSPWGIVPWTVLGLHVHYYFLYDLLVVVLAALALAATRPDLRRPAWRLVPPLATALVLFLPWTLHGLVPQLHAGLPAGSTYTGVRMLAEAIAHLLFLNASLGGDASTYGLALPGAAAGALLGALGVARLSRGSAREREHLALLLALGLGAPVLAFAMSHVHDQASFNWRYVAGSLGPIAFLVAAGADGRHWRLAPVALLLACELAVSVVVARSPGQEDFRGAVAHVLARARPGDAVLHRPIWPQDPELSPTDWGWYADRLEPPPGGTRPAAIPAAGIGRALAHDRVWVLHRSQYPAHALPFLRRHFPVEEVAPVSPMVRVHLFRREK